MLDGSAVALCTECGGALTRWGTGPEWCLDCEWNLDAFDPSPNTRRTRRLRREHRAAFAANRRLLGLFGPQPPHRPGWSAARAALIAVSVALFLGDAALLGFGGYLLVAGTAVWKALGLFLVLIGIELRPRLPRLRRGAEIVPRADHPELYALVDRICTAVGSPMVDGIVIDESFNAWCGRYGLRRRTVVGIGLPLWAALGPHARLAILGHELGHLTNGDPGMKLLTQPALTTFGRLGDLFDPKEFRYDQRLGFASLLANAVGWVLFAPIAWGFRQLHARLWRVAMRDHQRAEVYADTLAVDLGGTAGAAEVFTSLLLGETVIHALVRAARPDATRTELRDAAGRALRENGDGLRRLEQHSLRAEASLSGTHPPTGLRLRLVHSWPAVSAGGQVDELDVDRADAELEPEFRHLLRTLVNTRSDRAAFVSSARGVAAADQLGRAKSARLSNSTP